MGDVRRPSLLVDTNVWFDLHLPDRPNPHPSRKLVSWCSCNVIPLVFLSSAQLDVYRVVGRWYKERICRERGRLSEHDARAVKRLAWDRVNEMQELGTPVPVDCTDALMAARYRDIHNDLEDDLVAAAALRVKANHLVTNDRSLLRHASICGLTPQSILLALMPGDALGTQYGTPEDTSWLYERLSREETGIE